MDNVHNRTTIFRAAGFDTRSVNSDASTKVFVKRQVDITYDSYYLHIGTAK